MLIHIGLENNIEGRSLAWALDYPGCFAYGVDGSSAVVAMGRAIPTYANWLGMHTETPWFNPPAIDIRLVETWECFFVDANLNRVSPGHPEASEINAWFFHDWKPLTAEDVNHALQLLSWSRTDLLAIVSGLSDAQMDLRKEGQRWSIRSILDHIGEVEGGYLDRLGLAGSPETGLTSDPLALMAQQRRRLETVLPSLVGQQKVVGVEAEFWSPRKLVRRAVWHEIDAIRHILGLLAEGI